jgi:hypothetical protein
MRADNMDGQDEEDVLMQAKGGRRFSPTLPYDCKVVKDQDQRFSNPASKPA